MEKKTETKIIKEAKEISRQELKVFENLGFSALLGVLCRSAYRLCLDKVAAVDLYSLAEKIKKNVIEL